MTITSLEAADLATLQRARNILDELLGDTDLTGDISPEFRACQALCEILQVTPLPNGAPSPIPPNPFYLQLPGGGELLVFGDPEMGSSEIDLCDRDGCIVCHDSPDAVGIALHPIDHKAIWNAAGGAGE